MDSGERHDIHCEEELERKRLRAIANYGVAQFCPNIQTQKAIELLEDATKSLMELQSSPNSDDTYRAKALKALSLFYNKADLT